MPRGKKSVAVKDAEVEAKISELTEKVTQASREKEEKEQREKREKEKARAAIVRAQKHLNDWYHRLDEEGYFGMAAEVKQATEGLSSAILMLGGAVALQASVKNTGWWQR